MKTGHRTLRALLVLIPAIAGCAVIAFGFVQWPSSRPALYKHEWSIDAYSTWSMYAVDATAAAGIIEKHHDEMAFVDDYLLQTKDVEQATRSIFSIVVRSPTGKTPDWWSPPSRRFPGRATENMLWYKEADYGVAQGCYTLYDTARGQLWVYEYACQHNSLWPRGTQPKYHRTTRAQD